jgi:hypothetical protein
MSLPSWFSGIQRQRERSPRLSALVERVVDYMRSHPGTDAFFPQVVAAALGDTELAVLTAFGELDDAGIVKPQYGTYCRISSTPINVYDSLANVPDEEMCPDCAQVVSLGDETEFIDLYFIVDREGLARWKRAAA